MIICQGDLFWVDLRRAKGSEPKNRRPVVVVQRDAINQSKFGTVLVVPFTKQTKHANIPGNVMLKKGEGNLPRDSLARCTHVMVIDKGRITEKIGTLPNRKTQEIIDHVIWVLGRGKAPALNFIQEA